MKTFDDFMEDLGHRESTNDYHCVNDFGYMGRWQFGKPRLWDLGLSIGGWMPGWANGTPEDHGKVIMSREEFLTDKTLQDNIFRLHVIDILKTLRRKHADTQFTESSLVAVVHLLGFGGLKKFLNGDDSADGLGTKASEYATLFNRYDLSDLA